MVLHGSKDFDSKDIVLYVSVDTNMIGATSRLEIAQVVMVNVDGYVHKAGSWVVKSC